MMRVLREIREEVEDIYATIEEAEDEDAKALQLAARNLLRLLSSQEVKREAQKRTELALSVTEFAEWQSTGYIDDRETYQLISRTLWHRVAENVQDVLEREPKTPSFSQPWNEQSLNQPSG